ncbi:hypothetical protein ACIBL3_00125 [Kribbella sp. NPDC050124]|uniref:hypothetical protein n=1 Tax=Kribbella sp. NPDC050124 TaxID=3364114 RepID=UPI00379F1205
MLRTDDGLEWQPAADPSAIAAVEHRLGIELPTELRGQYQATDGIYHKPASGS